MAKKSATKIAAKDADQYMLRLPSGMRGQIAKLAEENGRSMNTEIVAAIEQHLKSPARLDAVERFIETHRKAIEALSSPRKPQPEHFLDWDAVLRGVTVAHGGKDEQELPPSAQGKSRKAG